MKCSEMLNKQNFLVLRGYKRSEIGRMTISEFLETYQKEIRDFR